LNGIKDIWRTMKVVARHRVLLAMTVLVGAASFFVGNAYQAQMPGFARDLNVGRADLSYSALLAADACGGLIGGILLESRGLLQPRTRTAFVLAMIWCLALAGFARANSYALALCLLFIAGFVELAFNSMAQRWCSSTRPTTCARGHRRILDVGHGLRTSAACRRAAGLEHRHPLLAVVQRMRAARRHRHDIHRAIPAKGPGAAA